MAESPNMIRERIQKRRSELGHKLDQLQEKVMGPIEAVEDTVEDVAETTEETIETLGDILNLPKQTRKHPWVVTGGAIAVGFVGSLIWNWLGSSRSTSSTTTSPPHPPTTPSAREDEEPSKESESQQGSFFDTLGSALRPPLERLQRVAVRSAIEVFQDSVVHELPEKIERPTAEIVNRMASHFGVEPEESYSHSNGSHAEQ